MKILLVIDMQNDFIDGALGTAEAVAIVPAVAEKIKNFDGMVLFTRDTHGEDYLETQEGRKLPVVHCVAGTSGWQLNQEIADARESIMTVEETGMIIDKPTFGSAALGAMLRRLEEAAEPIEQITLVGLCTDICVISNAMVIKAFLPEVPIVVESACCAGVSPESHRQALEAMKVCQIEVR